MPLTENGPQPMKSSLGPLLRGGDHDVRHQVFIGAYLVLAGKGTTWYRSGHTKAAKVREQEPAKIRWPLR